jgi:hypothetical protein
VHAAGIFSGYQQARNIAGSAGIDYHAANLEMRGRR